MKEIKIQELENIKIGSAENKDAATGCTVILCEQGMAAGLDVRGGGPASRETELLKPTAAAESIHAVLLSGGSAFGLDAAGGVMEYLEERNIGFDVGITKVPLVCESCLFDLMVGDHRVRPDKAMGYAACEAALRELPFQEGNFGAGTGCTIGKIRGAQFSMKGGIGACAFRQGDLMVGAVVACNAMGDVLENGTILAGARDDSGRGFADSEAWLVAHGQRQRDVFSGKLVGENTVIGCVVTNAAMNKAQATKLAAVAQNGIARGVRPANATFDGDCLFAMCHGTVQADPDAVGILAARAVEEAIVRGVKAAESLHGRIALRDL